MNWWKMSNKKNMCTFCVIFRFFFPESTQRSTKWIQSISRISICIAYKNYIVVLCEMFSNNKIESQCWAIIAQNVSIWNRYWSGSGRFYRWRQQKYETSWILMYLCECLLWIKLGIFFVGLWRVNITSNTNHQLSRKVYGLLIPHSPYSHCWPLKNTKKSRNNHK